MRETNVHPPLPQDDHRDIEAEAFAITWLVGSLPKERLAPEVLLYALNNRGMAWRAFRVICYLSWYHQRIRLANMLERVLVGYLTKGTA